MIFRKTERRKLPVCAALVVGGLAVVGFYSIKRHSAEMCSSISSKMKRMFSAKERDEKMIPFYPLGVYKDIDAKGDKE